MKYSLFLPLLASTATTASKLHLEASNSGIQKVTSLLKDMQKQVQAETGKGQAQADKFEKECITSITTFEKDLEFSLSKENDYSARHEGESGKSQALKGQVENELAPTIAQAQDEKKKSQSLWQDTNVEDSKIVAELEEASVMLNKAYNVLKMALQGPGSKNEDSDATSFVQYMSKKSYTEVIETKKMLIGLGAIVSASNYSNKENLASFMNDVDENTDNNNLKFNFNLLQSEAPQATKAANYQSKSGGILDAIQKMSDENEANLSQLREKVLKDRHSNELLQQDLSSKITSKSEQLQTAKEQSSEHASNAGKAKQQLQQTKESTKSLKKQLKDTKRGCKEYKEEWEARKKDAGEEVVVIGKAVEILSGKFGEESGETAEEGATFFVQIKQHMKQKTRSASKHFLALTQTQFKHLSSDSENAVELRNKLSNKLRKLGRDFDVMSLVQASYSLSDSTSGKASFDKILKLIDDMIVKLEDEQAAEAAKHGQCEADKKKGNAQVKKTTNKLKKLQVRAEKANAEAASLTIELQELNASVQTANKNQADSARLREEQRVENTAQIKEAKEAVEALDSAIQVLSEYYGSKSEGSDNAEGIANTTGKASAIIEILETSQSDFEKLRQDTERSEKDASAKFDEQVQDSKVTLAKQTALIQGKEKERSNVEALLGGDLDNDVAEASKALDAAGTFLKGVNEACTPKVMSFEEKQEKRAAEIAGLKEALTILDGSSEE